MHSRKVLTAVTADNFESIIKENSIIFLDFWATWCNPCKDFNRICQQVAPKYQTSILFAQVNVEEEQELAQTFHIQSIPHLLVFKKGIVIYSDTGTMPIATLEELAQQALTADVSKIRAELDQDETS